MPPAKLVTSSTLMPAKPPTIVPLLTMPPKNLVMSNISTPALVLVDAEILPLLVMPPTLLSPKAPPLSTKMPFPLSETIKPLLLILPNSVLNWRISTPLDGADIVPLFATPPPTLLLLLPKVVKLLTRMPSDPAEILPLLVMPPPAPKVATL